MTVRERGGRFSMLCVIFLEVYFCCFKWTGWRNRGSSRLNWVGWYFGRAAGGNKRPHTVISSCRRMCCWCWPLLEQVEVTIRYTVVMKLLFLRLISRYFLCSPSTSSCNIRKQYIYCTTSVACGEASPGESTHAAVPKWTLSKTRGTTLTFNHKSDTFHYPSAVKFMS